MKPNHRWITWSVVALLCAAISPVWSQQFHPGQEKLLAKNAALRDGQRNLLEQIKGLRIDGSSTVRDFVTQSDQINTAMMHELRGATIVPGSETWDGELYRLEVQVTIQQVRAAIEQIQRTYPSGRTYVTENMITMNREVLIKAQGQGSTRAAAVGAPLGAVPGAASAPAPYMGTAAIVPRQVPPGWENVTVQGRLLAERAARADAMRKLAERIRGVHITATTTVRDFVTQSDAIDAQFRARLVGARQVGPTRFLPDQTCEMDLEVSIQDVTKWLTEVQDWAVHPGAPHLDHPIRTYQFERIMDFSPERVLRETGAGVPRGDTIRGAAPASSSFAPPPPAAAPVEVVSAKGSGVPRDGEAGAAARLSAERAAEVDARRNLLEKVQGVLIEGQTTVKDFMVQSDQVRASVQSMLQGSDLSEPKYMSDGSVEVIASVPLDKIFGIVRPGGPPPVVRAQPAQ
ncbi:MAG: LPP20 family lipoprotein [Verrucomicrobia bacterium]|nr:LPP20 family lipoprotein [Verrucomicrobiota bacterium]